MHIATVIPIGVAALNALTIFISATVVMLVYGFRSKTDGFDVIGWFYDNRSRFVVGAILITGYSALTVLTPDLSALLAILGFNADAAAPISFGLALAAFLIGGVSKNKS